MTPGAALAFLLSAPAINPIVLVSTAVAFPGHPEFVLARLSASLLAAVVVGLLWVRFGKQGWITPRRLHEHTGVNRWSEFGATVRHDFLQAGGLPRARRAAGRDAERRRATQHLHRGGRRPGAGSRSAERLAVLLSICSEADAFVAASLAEFSSTAKLAFLVVGPMVDIKLIALQVGTFGRSFSVRFAPVTLVVAIGSAVGVAAVLL